MREDHDDLRNLAADANDRGRRGALAGAGVAMTPSGDAFKENNPKDAFGILKASLSWVSMPVVMEMAVGMAEGGYK